MTIPGSIREKRGVALDGMSICSRAQIPRMTQTLRLWTWRDVEQLRESVQHSKKKVNIERLGAGLKLPMVEWGALSHSTTCDNKFWDFSCIYLWCFLSKCVCREG